MIRIQQGDRGVTVSYVNSKTPSTPQIATAEWCVCTIPLSILGQIQIDVGPRMKAAIEKTGVARQILLIPEIVELDETDAARLAARAEELARFGLVIETFGPGAVAVRETPSMLGDVDVRGLINDLAEHAAEWDDALPLERRLMHVSATMACYGSVRAGRRLKPEEMNALLREMEAVPNSGQCNHGRPTYVELKLTDIERLFGRR